MIDLGKIWLPQIIWYANFISRPDDVWEVWVNGNRNVTSVTNFDELITQVFDDLDSDQIVLNSLPNMDGPSDLKIALKDFIDELDYVERLDRLGSFRDSKHLLESSEWARLVEFAITLGNCAKRGGVPDSPVIED
jgi:hypothetical protein